MAEPAMMDPAYKLSLGDRVAGMLRDEILSGRGAPGDRLNLDDYKTSWDISITPLRDAAKKLEADGLVVIAPRRGVFVATIDREALFDIFEIRQALEPLVTEKATPHIPLAEIEHALKEHRAIEPIVSKTKRIERLQRIDHMVHDLVVAHCPNARLARLVTGLRDSILWCRNSVQRSVPDAFDPSLLEHIAICEALLTRDPARASRAMADHVAATLERTKAALARAD